MKWLHALTTLQADVESHVLITVINTRGSIPRDMGTKMVVSNEMTFDTIGGGALEFQAIEIARELLKKNKAQQHTETFNLGKDLKQCCGGVVSVFFEVFPATDFVLNIFGAGHIAQALSKILAEVDCRVNLFDSRQDLLDLVNAENIQKKLLDKPELAVESCAKQSYYLVMTHDHALDQQLCEAILSRNDSLYCGLIGSRTKALKFRQRLLKKDFSQDEIKHLSCPTGLQKLKTKHPMEIAVSIVADLLLLREKSQQSMLEADNTSETNSSKIVQLESRD